MVVRGVVVVGSLKVEGAGRWSRRMPKILCAGLGTPRFTSDYARNGLAYEGPPPTPTALTDGVRDALAGIVHV